MTKQEIKRLEEFIASHSKMTLREMAKKFFPEMKAGYTYVNNMLSGLRKLGISVPGKPAKSVYVKISREEYQKFAAWKGQVHGS